MIRVFVFHPTYWPALPVKHVNFLLTSLTPGCGSNCRRRPPPWGWPPGRAPFGHFPSTRATPAPCACGAASGTPEGSTGPASVSPPCFQKQRQPDDGLLVGAIFSLLSIVGAILSAIFSLLSIIGAVFSLLSIVGAILSLLLIVGAIFSLLSIVGVQFAAPQPGFTFFLQSQMVEFERSARGVKREAHARVDEPVALVLTN
eukprot:9065765-Pyramimonas_sp.AAC.2